MGLRFVGVVWALVGTLLAAAAPAEAQTIYGVVRDETGATMPGVTVEVRVAGGALQAAVTNASGAYAVDHLPTGAYHLTFTLPNFATARRDVIVAAGASTLADAVLHLSLSAEVTVTGKGTFTNLADAERPAENLVGIAQSASQGAITAQQLDARPMMRTGEVLETVPGVIISQHSGEGKANQYYLRGFNLDHGTDFATEVAGMPVNLPTHAHGHGYSDLNFLIPELVSGVQFSKGPYFADRGDFATAGAANINYTNALDRPVVRIGGGDEGYGRALVAASLRAGAGRLLAAFEVEHNDGPWVRADDYRKVNTILRYSAGDGVNGFAVTAMGYRGRWNSTDQIPLRAVTAGAIGRFGTLDPTDGGSSYRYSGSLEWQRTYGNAATKIIAYGIGYDLDLFSNFTGFLDDPEHGDQVEQADHRFVTGVKVSHRRLGRWAGRAVQNTVGLQLRNDDIGNVALYHTQARRRLDTTRQDNVVQTSGALYFQNEIAWAPWLRTLAGIRADVYRFRIAASDSANLGVDTAHITSPKGGIVIGPFHGTELYANAGAGFHSNDARIATNRANSGNLANPLVRADGAEFGLRTVAIPHLQSSVAIWTLDLASELIFAGDAGTTKAGRPSRRSGVEWASYYHPRPWLVLDGDVAWSHARFTDVDPAGDRIPGSVQTVVSAGATVDALSGIFGSVRLRYFGPRPLVEGGAVRSKATRLVNLEGGRALTKRIRATLDVFNLFDAKDSDVDYYYRSRLPGEPSDGVNDIHLHPTLPRTARLNLTVTF